VASAFDFIRNDNTGLPIKWPQGTVPIRLMLGATNFNDSARSQAEVWNAQMGAVQFTSTTTTGAPSDRNGSNELAFSNNVYGRAYEDTVLAVTTTWSSGNERTEGDILFNRGKTWSVYTGSLRGGEVDFGRVALHELGHLLGLDHPDEATPAQPIITVMNSRITNIYELTQDDINGVRMLYGPPGVPANNNFADAAAIDLASGSAIMQGYNTNATKEPGEPIHDAASTINPGGRSVWWRLTLTAASPLTLDTKGSIFDTTLAVYTGMAVSNLQLVASSDDIDPGKIQASLLSFNGTANTTYYIAVDGFNGNDGHGADSGGIKLNVTNSATAATAPVITTQPASVTVTAGDPVTFSVVATGTPPLTYQWRLNGLTISGATASSFSLNRAATGNAGTYSVIVTNIVGSTTSANATLTVNASPTTPTPPTTPNPPSGGGGGGGGGGAPSLWFCFGLAALGLGRLLQRSRR